MICLSGCAQNSDYLKYSYDAAGNRAKREIISLNKSMVVTDTTHNTINRNDSNMQAATQSVVADASPATANDASSNPSGGNQSAGSTANTYTQDEQKVLAFPYPTAGQLQIKLLLLRSTKMEKLQCMICKENFL